MDLLLVNCSGDTLRGWVLVDSTLGDDTGFSWVLEGKVGSCCTQFRLVARSSNALQIGSPACKERVVVDGGCVKMLITSVAACCKKSTSWISGNVTFLGRKVIVSHILVLCKVGK